MAAIATVNVPVYVRFGSAAEYLVGDLACSVYVQHTDEPDHHGIEHPHGLHLTIRRCRT